MCIRDRIIKLDLQKKEDKAIYQGTQKVLVIVMIIVEAVPQIYGYLKPNPEFLGGGEWANFAIVIQIVMGALLVFFMDELISKWGIGSGISLFIAAGVSQAIFTGLFNWIPAGGAEWSLNTPPSGVVPGTYFLATESTLEDMVGGYFEAVSYTHLTLPTN